MFRKLLIANRGEIACRIARTARRMGIGVAAVYSEADAGALHTQCADEAWLIGDGPARASYLDSGKIIEIARECGAEAIHPGYGFLSESADFAAQCREAGVAFVGPSPETMRMVGAKSAARHLARRIGVPILPGYEGEAQSAKVFADAAERIGYPVMVKASAGGGGRGMRIVGQASDLQSAIESARREALAAFGDGQLLLEKYLLRPRHVELQIFGDAFGEIVVFPERDCSLQRNHQKVVEETPAPGLPCEFADALKEAATAIARACDYIGAGTVEFLVSGDAFFFLEVNARLQVEHTVTEMISNLDLVEWQLIIAAGERLPLKQPELRTEGWAIEARVCAEDPAQDFRPAFGRISHLRFPERREDLRIETGYRAGDMVSTHYDSLLAKVIVVDDSHDGAVRKMAKALSRTELVGVASNLDFLRAIVSDDRFISGACDTGAVTEIMKLSAAPTPPDSLLFAAAAALWIDEIRRRETASAKRAGEESSPWSMADGWRLYERTPMPLSVRVGERTLDGAVSAVSGESFRIEMMGDSISVRAMRAADRMRLRLGRVEKELGVVLSADGGALILGGRNFPFRWIDPLRAPPRSQVEDISLRAPLPARVARLLVKAGDRVEKGRPLLLLEAMKMEIPLTASRDGIIEAIYCAEGDSVQEGEEIVTIAEAS